MKPLDPADCRDALREIAVIDTQIEATNAQIDRYESTLRDLDEQRSRLSRFVVSRVKASGLSGLIDDRNDGLWTVAKGIVERVAVVKVSAIDEGIADEDPLTAAAARRAEAERESDVPARFEAVA